VTAGGLIWLAAAHWELRQALRWWMQQEIQSRVGWADQIQNGLLQDLFALRLELQRVEAASTQDWLAAERLHQQLADLSTALVSPHLPASLPLALRHQLQRWQTAHPGCDLQLDLPTDWPLESLAQSQIVLTTLERLLDQSGLPDQLLDRLIVGLEQRAGRARLTVELGYGAENRSIQSGTRAKELKYLRRCFCCLMPGWCRAQFGATAVRWQFGWTLSLDGGK
jgi:hypothetical protein